MDSEYVRFELSPWSYIPYLFAGILLFGFVFLSYVTIINLDGQYVFGPWIVIICIILPVLLIIALKDSIYVNKYGIKIQSFLHTTEIYWRDIISISYPANGGVGGIVHNYEIRTTTIKKLVPLMRNHSQFEKLLEKWGNMETIGSSGFQQPLAGIFYKRWSKKGVPYEHTSVYDIAADIRYTKNRHFKWVSAFAIILPLIYWVLKQFDLY